GSVAAQIQPVGKKRVPSAHVVAAVDFDQEGEHEADRALRFGRTLAVIAVELANTDAESMDAAPTRIAARLRSVDVVAQAAAGRLHVMLPEASKEQAQQVARRTLHALMARKLTARLGIAVFPGDAASAESLPLAAEVALRQAAPGGVGTTG